MKRLSLKKLVETYKKDYNSSIVTINDLLIKEMNGENLSAPQFQAIQNFYRLKMSYLRKAINTVFFSDRSFTAQLAANFVPYNKFI